MLAMMAADEATNLPKMCKLLAKPLGAQPSPPPPHLPRLVTRNF